MIAALAVAAVYWATPAVVAAPVAQAQTIATSTPVAATTTPIVRNIRYYATKYGVDFNLAKDIAVCESNLDETIDNKTSSASGLYQFLDGTWAQYAKLKWGTTKGHSVYDYGDSAELGVWVISKYGTGDWDASKNCWG